MTNNGTVHANVSNALKLNTNNKTNNGLMKASNVGCLDVYVDVDGAGRWEADGGKIQLNSGVDVTTTGSISVTNGGELELNNATMTGSDLSMDSAGILDINSTVSLSGDLSFAMTDESKWDWGTSAALEMTGGEAGPWSEWNYLEIGGRDDGLVASGFTDNFDLTNLVLDDSAHIYLADWINNGNRSSSEALYVDDLDVLTDTVLNLNGLNLYTYLDSNIHLVAAGEGYFFGGGTIIDTPVPIPTTLLLLGSGLFGLVGLRRKFRS